MKRQISFIALLLVLFFVLGCGVMRKGLIEMSREDVKNAEASREAARNFISTWNLNSGFIKGALGDRITEFPMQFVEAMDELDTVANMEESVDYDLGYFLGLRVRTLETLIQETLKMYAPDIFDLVPFPLKF
jgi:predicted small lipoprotein YifL